MKLAGIKNPDILGILIYVFFICAPTVMECFSTFRDALAIIPIPLLVNSIY